MKWYIEVLKKYFVFNGRARRTEFWMFVLISFIISVVLGFIEGAVGLVGVLSTIYGVAVLIPGLAVSVRRLHDTNRSGFWIFIGFIPLIGQIILLIFCVQDSQEGDNQYGPYPKTETV